ncbi:MAG: cation transporter [Clostridia bacterium]|nr:cation transporter [Clostridia bacterium]
MDRFKSVKLASIFGIIGNIILLFIKATIGLVTNSQAMIADAFNSAGDIFSSIVTFIGNKIASKPVDEDHNLGHGKAEYIYSMIISIIMIFTTLIILKDSIVSIFYREQYNFSIWLVVVCAITICIKFGLYIYINKISKKLNNLLLKANSNDHRNDCIITTMNLISCILSYYGIFFVDGIVGTIISTWILITAVKIFKESYDVLMDKSINEDTKKKVFEIIDKHKEIKYITHFNSTPVGYRYQISFSIFVDGNLSTFESHEIADKLEKEIGNSIEEIYLTVIHVNPI